MYIIHTLTHECIHTYTHECVLVVVAYGLTTLLLDSIIYGYKGLRRGSPPTPTPVNPLSLCVFVFCSVGVTIAYAYTIQSMHVMHSLYTIF